MCVSGLGALAGLTPVKQQLSLSRSSSSSYQLSQPVEHRSDAALSDLRQASPGNATLPTGGGVLSSCMSLRMRYTPGLLLLLLQPHQQIHILPADWENGQQLFLCCFLCVCVCFFCVFFLSCHVNCIGAGWVER